MTGICIEFISGNMIVNLNGFVHGIKGAINGGLMGFNGNSPARMGSIMDI
jgi:hypothetical protein